MTAALVTLADAKDHLRIITVVDDADIQRKLDQAEAIILERCRSTAWWRAITPTWTPATVPLSVQAAIALMLTHLHEQRGDNMVTVDEALWAAIDRLLALNKDPVLA